jgi:hypothetical protein
MSIYHCSIKVFSRAKGDSAVVKAAYRSGSILRDERLGETHDYHRKTGVVHCEILLPSNAPAEYADRSTLWNAVERVEKAANSHVSRVFLAMAALLPLPAPPTIKICPSSEAAAT